MPKNIDATPTWAAVLPILVHGLGEGPFSDAYDAALGELRRMARAADQFNAAAGVVASVGACKLYNDKLDALEASPNGDDYNALLDLLNGGAFVAPKAGGR